MSLDAFNSFGYEVPDEEDYYEKISINELEPGSIITGKPIVDIYENDEDEVESWRDYSGRILILTEDIKSDEGTPIKVSVYCPIPQPFGFSPEGHPLTNLYRNDYRLNTYNVIFSILKLQGKKDIYNKNGNPIDGFKNISVEAYLKLLGEQEEITIEVKNTEDEDYNTIEITNIK